MRSVARGKPALSRVAALLLAAALVAHAGADDASQATRLVELLELQPGMTVADVGAGRGGMSVLMAKHIGAGGRVYSTDINEDRLAEIRAALLRERLDNVVVVKGLERDTNLPEACCDAVFLRDVYHHLGDPAAMNRSLFEALKPGGRLAVIDFMPKAGSKRPDAVPENREGHGIRPEQVFEEVAAAGFSQAQIIDDWGEGMFLVLFRKPPGR